MTKLAKNPEVQTALLEIAGALALGWAIRRVGTRKQSRQVMGTLLRSAQNRMAQAGVLPTPEQLQKAAQALQIAPEGTDSV